MARRYLLVRLLSDHPVSGEQFHSAVAATIRTLFGEIGAARINARLIRFDAPKSEAVLACARDHMNELQTAVAMTTHVAGSQIAPLALRVSGTIKGLRGKR